MGIAQTCSSTAVEFLDFIRHAERLVGSQAKSAPTAEFQRFITQAVPLVVANIKGHLPDLARRAALAARWLVRNDLLAVAGFGFVEDAYTELMAWALHPDTDPASAVDRQRAWLQSVGLDDPLCGDMSCVPQPQFITASTRLGPRRTSLGAARRPTGSDRSPSTGACPMSSTFEKFGEAARLYARYEAVVDNIHDEYQADVAAFADALRDRVRSLVRGGEFDEEAASTKAKSRVWYIWDGKDVDEEVSYIWFYAQDARLVVPGVLHLLVATDRQNDARRRQVTALQHELKLPGHCRVFKGEAGSLFTIAISYGDGDSIAADVEPVVELLTLLYQIDQRTKLAAPKKRGPS